MRVVVEIIVGAGPLRTQVSKTSGIWMCAGNIKSGARDVGEDEAHSLFGNPQRPRAGCYLYNTCDHVCELVRDEARYEEQENSCGDEATSRRCGGETGDGFASAQGSVFINNRGSPYRGSVPPLIVPYPSRPRRE